MTNNVQRDFAQALALRVIKRWPSKRTRQWVLNFLHEASEQTGIEAIVAIGSSVRRLAARRKSDIDLIVIYRECKPLIETTPIDVDIRFFECRSVQTLISNGHDLLGWALRFGKTIYDPNDFWKSVVTELKDVAPFPSAAVAIERAHKARRHGKELLLAGDEDAAREQYLTMLTHYARALLLKANVYPISRPELPDQLRDVDRNWVAQRITEAMTFKNKIDFEILHEIPAENASVA